MKEAAAKKHLRRMRRDFTAGSILHLLAGLLAEDAEEARLHNKSLAYEHYKSVEAALLVVGTGWRRLAPANPRATGRERRPPDLLSERSPHDPHSAAKTGEADDNPESPGPPRPGERIGLGLLVPPRCPARGRRGRGGE